MRHFFLMLALASSAHAGDLVDVTKLDASIALDIRYATTNNFTHKIIYPVARCWLRPEVAAALVRVQRALKARKLSLKVHDCYRPFSVQLKFWELVPDERYVARPVLENGVPVNGSRHNRGAAVDLTLVDENGAELEMPSAYDDFSERAHRNYKGASRLARLNMRRLERAMVRGGFVPFETEWWHFDHKGWEKYRLADTPLE